MTALYKQPEIPRKNRIRKFGLADFLIVIGMSIYALAILYPFYNAILVSLVPQRVYVTTPFMIWPKAIIWDSYKFVFKSSLIWSSFRNSVIITVFGTSYNMLMTILCAYAFTKPIPGRRFFRFFVVFTIFFSGGTIPFFVLVNSIEVLKGSLAIMIIPTGIVILYMLIISDYFKNLPPSLEESAKIDGAGDWMILIRIILPLSLPLLATFTLYYAVDRWNEWFLGMLFIRKTSLMPLQLVLRQIISDANFVSTQIVPGRIKPDIYGDSIKMASVMVTMFPLMMLYPVLQRYFLSGLTLGAVKE